LQQFSCASNECKSVTIQLIHKKDAKGVERVARRYLNANGVPRKCFKLHHKERVTDFILRTQQPRDQPDQIYVD
jgi:hypothetical protein